MRRAMGGHPMEDRRCRRHRILREELHACGERTKTNRFVPGHQILGLVRIRQSEVQGTAHLADRVSPEFRGLDVLLYDLPLLVSPDIPEGALPGLAIQVEQPDGRAPGNWGPHQRGRGEALRPLPTKAAQVADLL